MIFIKNVFKAEAKRPTYHLRRNLGRRILGRIKELSDLIGEEKWFLLTPLHLPPQVCLRKLKFNLLKM